MTTSRPPSTIRTTAGTPTTPTRTMTLSPLRSRIVAQAHWGVSHAAQIHYAETRPIPLAAWRAGRLPLTTDCSGFVTCCYYAAGAPDPNGQGYDGQGYTGTLLSHLPAIPEAEAEPGDLVVFGTPPGHHVVVLVDAGGLCASHGTEADPSLQTLAGLRAYFAGQQVTFLRGAPPSPPPQPAGHLAWRVVEDGRTIYRGEHLAGVLTVIGVQARRHQAHKGWSIRIDRIEVTP